MSMNESMEELRLEKEQEKRTKLMNKNRTQILVFHANKSKSGLRRENSSLSDLIETAKDDNSTIENENPRSNSNENLRSNSGLLFKVISML